MKPLSGSLTGRPGHVGRAVQAARVGAGDDAHADAQRFQFVPGLEHRQQGHVAGDREDHGAVAGGRFIQLHRTVFDALARLRQGGVDRQRRLRGDDGDALVVAAQRPLVGGLDLVRVAREEREHVAVAHLRGEVVLDLRTLVGPAVATLFQRTGGEHADHRRRLAAQLGHGLGDGLDDGPAVDGEALVAQPQRARAEQRQAGGEAGAGVLVERLVDLPGRTLVVQVVGDRMTDFQRDVDIRHRTRLVTVGVADHEARVVLADVRNQGAEGRGRHLLVADREFLDRQRRQRRVVEHALGHRSLRGRAAAGADEVLAHEGPGLRAEGAALQAFDHVLGVQRVGRIQVVRLGAQLVHAGALQLLDDEHGAGAGQGRTRCLVDAAQHRAGEGQAGGLAELAAVDVGARLVRVVEVFGVDQHHFLEAVAGPVGVHLLVRPGAAHGVVLLAVAIPDQRGQVVGDRRVGGVEVHHRIEDVRLAHAAVADGDREQRARMQQGAGHGEVLALAERTGRGQQAGDGAGQVAEQAVLLAEAGHHVADGADTHFLQRSIEEHGRVEARRVVADLGDDVGVAEHDQRRIGLGAGGEAARMAGSLAAADLQREIAQRVGHQQGLVGGRCRIIGIGDRAGALAETAGAAACSVEAGPGVGVMLDARRRRRG
jgi:hypothetical protein